MGTPMIDGVLLTPLSRIPSLSGDIAHAMKRTDPGFSGFGEAYFSAVSFGAVKAWKRHRRMTLNLVVPVGEIRFVLYDDRKESTSSGMIQELDLSRDNYFRLTVPPMLWMGFMGVGQGLNLLLNVADILHDPDEVARLDVTAISYEWETLR